MMLSDFTRNWLSLGNIRPASERPDYSNQSVIRVAPPASENLIIDPSQGNARDWMGDVHRNMWADYKARFRPFEDALMGSVGQHGNALQQAGSAVDKAFDVTSREHERRLSGFGVSMRPDERAVHSRTMGLQHAAAKAGALNTTRTALRDRDIALVGGGLGSLAESRTQ
jgi:hypothetical protein